MIPRELRSSCPSMASWREWKQTSVSGTRTGECARHRIRGSVSRALGSGSRAGARIPIERPSELVDVNGLRQPPIETRARGFVLIIVLP
jgi:hypothetical protein